MALFLMAIGLVQVKIQHVSGCSSLHITTVVSLVTIGIVVVKI